MASEGPSPGPRSDPGDLAERFKRARQHIESLLPGAIATEGPQPMFLLRTAEGIRDRFLELRRRLAPLDLLPLLRDQGGRPALLLIPKPPPGRWAPRTNLILLLATVASTYLTGYLQSVPLVKAGLLSSAIVGGIAFSGSLLFILGSHEMGHKLVALRRGIDSSLPYFLPMLPPLGTMGAVIVTRTPAPNRDSLMELGASGPLAGFVAAIPVLLYGVTHSFVVDPSRLAQFGRLEWYPDPLLIRWMTQLFLNPPPGQLVLMHPVLFAGWIGLLVTSINLLPASMLDGGHVVRAAFGARNHMLLSYAGVALAVFMGAPVMALLIALLLRRGHVGPLDDLSPLSPWHWVMGASLVLVLVLSAMSLLPIFGLPFSR